mmetsp:Transcript_40113/g.119465  ORF Transcript_40113/g.119465 Transcript_40113/m.119465 type:complete len:368 (+) Transcript_40113:2767-3870(+)
MLVTDLWAFLCGSCRLLKDTIQHVSSAGIAFERRPRRVCHHRAVAGAAGPVGGRPCCCSEASLGMAIPPLPRLSGPAWSGMANFRSRPRRFIACFSSAAAIMLLLAASPSLTKESAAPASGAADFRGRPRRFVTSLPSAAKMLLLASSPPMGPAASGAADFRGRPRRFVTPLPSAATMLLVASPPPIGSAASGAADFRGRPRSSVAACSAALPALPSPLPLPLGFAAPAVTTLRGRPRPFRGEGDVAEFPPCASSTLTLSGPEASAPLASAAFLGRPRRSGVAAAVVAGLALGLAAARPCPFLPPAARAAAAIARRSAAVSCPAAARAARASMRAAFAANSTSASSSVAVWTSYFFPSAEFTPPCAT